jgi:hypothetical protein
MLKTEVTYGHMTLAHPAVWASALGSFLQRFPLECKTMVATYKLEENNEGRIQR